MVARDIGADQFPMPWLKVEQERVHARALLESQSSRTLDIGDGRLPPTFWNKVAITEGCWLWTAALRQGYAAFWLGKTMPAHRFAYEALIGPIPDGLQIDHLCRNRSCVNPNHMEAVTAQSNSLRAPTGGAANAMKSRCSRGHPFIGTNLEIQADGRRCCRTCRLDGRRRREAERRAAGIRRRRKGAHPGTGTEAGE